MIAADLPGVVWRKSSRSGTDSNCVEVAVVPGAVWRKSSRSGSDSNCVEVAGLPAAMAVRDSKDPDGPVLLFTRESWAAFIAGVRASEFDPR